MKFGSAAMTRMASFVGCASETRIFGGSGRIWMESIEGVQCVSIIFYTHWVRALDIMILFHLAFLIYVPVILFEAFEATYVHVTLGSQVLAS
jgi:hypothetical protein